MSNSESQTNGPARDEALKRRRGAVREALGMGPEPRSDAVKNQQAAAYRQVAVGLKSHGQSALVKDRPFMAILLSFVALLVVAMWQFYSLMRG